MTDSDFDGVGFIYDHAFWFYEPTYGTIAEKLRPGDSLRSATKRVTEKLKDKIGNESPRPRANAL